MRTKLWTLISALAFASALAICGVLFSTLAWAQGSTTSRALASDRSQTFANARGRDKIPPAVTATSPANGATGVSLGTTVTATFSAAVKNVTTTTFRLSAGGTPVSGTVTPSQATATFIPSAPLAYSATYTATVTTGVTDLRGNPLPGDYNWIFSTFRDG